MLCSLIFITHSAQFFQKKAFLCLYLYVLSSLQEHVRRDAHTRRDAHAARGGRLHSVAASFYAEHQRFRKC